MLTVIIPGKTEVYFKRTIEEVLEKATGEIQVFAVTDGYVEPEGNRVHDPRVVYIDIPPGESNQMRHAINEAVSRCTSEYIMKLDAHCMLDEGFDEKLLRDHQPNWVQVPRRLRLDAKKWEVEIDDRPPVDYEYWQWRKFLDGGLHGYKWDARTVERMDTPIDDVIDFQGSCWLMRRDWFNELGLMQTEGYGGFTQESTEISMKTWLNGGKVKVNKNTHYAHLHKGKIYGRMYSLDWVEKREGDVYSFNLFVNEHREEFIRIVESFPPMPKWPENWKDYLPELKEK